MSTSCAALTLARGLSLNKQQVVFLPNPRRKTCNVISSSARFPPKSKMCQFGTDGKKKKKSEMTVQSPLEKKKR